MSTIDPELKISSMEQETIINFSSKTSPIEFDCENRGIIIIDSVFTEEECADIKSIIDCQESVNIRTKLCLKFPQLSQIIISRCDKFIPKNPYFEDHYLQSLKHKNDHHNNDQYWNFSEINPNWRLVKCNLGSKLTKHFDGVYVKSVDFKSIYTIMVYLNDSDGDIKFDNLQVQPKLGRVVIFNQKLLHEGLENTSGFKYFIRSELMYQREKSIEKPADTRAMELYTQASVLIKDGRREEAEILEAQAFELSPLLERTVLNL
jgi:hypothetical protein